MYFLVIRGAGTKLVIQAVAEVRQYGIPLQI